MAFINIWPAYFFMYIVLPAADCVIGGPLCEHAIVWSVPVFFFF